MDLKTYLKPMSLKQRAEFAARCGSSRQHLTNISYGYKKAGPKLAIAIERESGGHVRADELCTRADWNFIRGTARVAAIEGDAS